MTRWALPVVALLIGLAVGGCGGGSPPTMSVYGDSATSGNTLAVRPVPQISSALGVRGIDYSMPGTTMEQVVLHDEDRADLVLFRHGGAHALHYGLAGLDRFDTLTVDFILKAQATGARVVIAGIIPVTPSPRLSEEDNLRVISTLDAYESRLQDIAQRTRVHFIPLRDVEFHGHADLLDEVHPNQGFSDRLSRRIVEHLTPIVKAL